MVTAAAVAVLAGTAVVACGSSATSGVVLNFYSLPDGSDQFGAAADDCGKASNGAYTVSLHKLPKAADDQRLQLARRLVANDPDVDILSMDVTWTAEFAEAGWVRAFPDDVNAQVRANTLKPSYDTATYQGKLWAVPMTTNTQLLWYRKDLVPTPPTTWDEMQRMADDLAAKGLPHYIEVQGKQYEGLTVWFNTLLTSGGGQMVDENGNVKVGDGDAARNAAQIMKTMATSPAADPSLSAAAENDARLAMEGGRAAFQLNYPFVYASISTPPPDGSGGGSFIDEQGKPTTQNTGRRVGDVFAWAPYPGVSAGKPATVTIGGINLAVNSASSHADLAQQAILCMRGEDNQKRNAVEGGLPPTLSALYADPAFQAKYPEWQAIRDSLSGGSVRPKTPVYQSISTVVSDILNPAADIQPDQVVSRLVDQIGKAQRSEGLVP
jgi:multiple sugar transport system substrate-binding protein